MMKIMASKEAMVNVEQMEEVAIGNHGGGWDPPSSNDNAPPHNQHSHGLVVDGKVK